MNIRTRVVTFAVSAMVCVALVPSAGAEMRVEDTHVGAAEVSGPYVTLLFSRTQMTAADDCVANNTNVVRLVPTVAPYLAGLSMTATGTLMTSRIREWTYTCLPNTNTLTASWSAATRLAGEFGWSFGSHTATYPEDLGNLTAAQSQAETCGSAETLEAREMPGAHGIIAYPGTQTPPTALQSNYSAHCFAWGRRYGSSGVTAASAGQTAPYWQNTFVANGGPCNVSTAPCYNIPSIGSPRYRLPSRFVSIVNSLQPGQWFTFQAYLLVTGRSPAYTTSPIRWDCTSDDPRLHWTNDNERYCYKDWQAVIRAINARPNITVTDPLTVGVAFGRPAAYTG